MDCPQWLFKPPQHASSWRRFPTLQDACVATLVSRRQWSLDRLDTRGMVVDADSFVYWKQLVRVSPAAVESWCPVRCASEGETVHHGPAGVQWAHEEAFSQLTSRCVGRECFWAAREKTLARFTPGDADWCVRAMDRPLRRGCSLVESGERLLCASGGALQSLDFFSGSADAGVAVTVERYFGGLESLGGSLYHWGPQSQGQRYALCMDVIDEATGHVSLAENVLSSCNRHAAVTAVPGRGLLVSVGGVDTLEHGGGAPSVRGQQRFDPRVGRWETFGHERATLEVPESCVAMGDSLFLVLGGMVLLMDLRGGRWLHTATFASDSSLSFSGLL
jgi:hypothetical protein